MASSTTAVGSIASDFRFTSADDTVNAISASIAAADTLLDASTTDSDTINITATAAMNAMTAVNIENATVNFVSGTPTAVFTNFTGLTSVSVSGVVAGTVTDSSNATLNGYTRVMTWNDADGWANSSSRNCGSLESGAKRDIHATAATRSGVTLTAANTGANETRDIKHNVKWCENNIYFRFVGCRCDVKHCKLAGRYRLAMRVSHNDITGITVAGGSATGSTTVRIDRQTGTGYKHINFLVLIQYRLLMTQRHLRLYMNCFGN